MVKEKPNSTRIYDKEGYRRRAACICVRSEAEAEVLLVTSSRRPELWIVPGGGVEPEEEATLTATREVLEEAGVIGDLGRCLGVFENSEHMHRTEVFVMVVTQELEEWEDSKTIGRKRQWFSIEEALSQLALHKPTQRTYLQQLRHSKHRCPNSAPPIISEHESCDDGDFTIGTPKDENSTPESATAAATPTTAATTTNDSGEMVMTNEEEAVAEERKEAEGGVSPSPAIAADEVEDAGSTNASPPTTPTT
ncbi:diphosphoinositol polyphosphate phosphohydrolase 1 [Anopheles darlingi]|uniref:diphosphoinositol polyphosphate phosphohydrolase 1 n=1 Tax=Anopheles darlingi TaxID=43151 RepID=UPI0021006530|nr:diphosphoinositol polyphosphate phosphohydrolase 1 [Anopheles darlingi]XP_049534642.1 diphosphoinositol polyphosphate phosphohydrolase 1 [Anopheles darlingi]